MEPSTCCVFLVGVRIDGGGSRGGGGVVSLSHPRLLVQLPMLLAHTTMDHESVLLLKEQLAGILSYAIPRTGFFP